MLKALKFCNDNHWYIIAVLLGISVIFWTYGCTSAVQSVIHPDQLIGRAELANELKYLVGLAEARASELDRQDSVKQSLLDAANVIGTSGNINPSGLLNIIATIGAVSFGLNRNQKCKALSKAPTA